MYLTSSIPCSASEYWRAADISGREDDLVTASHMYRTRYHALEMVAIDKRIDARILTTPSHAPQDIRIES
jgi:hypothetical protein